MNCQKKCDHEENCGNRNNNNNFNYVFLVIVLYILLAIIIGGNLFF